MKDDNLGQTTCCFCGQDIPASHDDPTYLTVGTRSEVTKTWWCHLACFNARLPNLPQPWNCYDINADRAD